MMEFKSEVAVKFAARVIEDCKHAPKLPWHIDGFNLIAADNNRIAEMVVRRDGHFVAGAVTALVPLAEMMLDLANMLVDAGLGDDEAVEKQRHIVECLTEMRRIGALPKP